MIILRHINTACSAFPSIVSVLITVPVLCCLAANSSFVPAMFFETCQTLLACCRVPSTAQNRLPVGNNQKCSAVQLTPWMGGSISSDPWACWHKALTRSPSRQAKIVSKVPAWTRLLPKQTRKIRAIHFHSGFSPTEIHRHWSPTGCGSTEQANNIRASWFPMQGLHGQSAHMQGAFD